MNAPDPSSPIRGITWSHARGRRPMEELARLANQPGALHVSGPGITWASQSLADFESRPIAELTNSFDLVILDHPSLGPARHDKVLMPMEDILAQDLVTRVAVSMIGAAASSYVMDGRHWALPVDAAAQVSAKRADCRDRLDFSTWESVLACDALIAIPTAGPHTLLALLGICAAFDANFVSSREHLAPDEILRPALSILRQLIYRTPEEYLELDPTQILDRISGEFVGPTVVGCPLTFSYVTYSLPGVTHRIAFVDAPAVSPGGQPGSVLGGTGIAVTARAAGRPHIADYVMQTVDPFAQRDVIPRVGGQPSAVAAWEDDHLNSLSLNFYRRTRRTQEAAWQRPRHAGWPTFQYRGSHQLYADIRTATPDREVLANLEALYTRSFDDREPD